MYAGETEPGQDTSQKESPAPVVSVTFRSAPFARTTKSLSTHQRTVFPRVTTAQETPERSDARQPPPGSQYRSEVSFLHRKFFMMSTEGMMLRICSMASWGFSTEVRGSGIIENQDTVFRLINRIQRCTSARLVGETREPQ